MEIFARFEDHLFNNWIDTEKAGIVLGPTLDLDLRTERFIGDGKYGITRWANELPTRNYRKPFVVLEKA